MLIIKSTGLTPCSHKVTLVLDDSIDVLQSAIAWPSFHRVVIHSYMIFLGCVLIKHFFFSGENLVSEQAIEVQEADETRRWNNRH